MARISTSPLNWLNTGAPSQMSPESTWIERAAGGPMSGSSASHGGPGVDAADALDHRRDAADAADDGEVLPGLRDEAEPLVDLPRREVVREEARVEIGGVDDGEVHVLAGQIGDRLRGTVHPAAAQRATRSIRMNAKTHCLH